MLETTEDLLEEQEEVRSAVLLRMSLRKELQHMRFQALNSLCNGARVGAVNSGRRL